MEKDEVHITGENFFFYPLDWIACGYYLRGIMGDLVEKLEERKEQYMEDHGYFIDKNNGYDAGLESTSRLTEPNESGKYR